MIHQFTSNGQTITLDVYSGAIHITDDISARAIQLCEKVPAAEARMTLLHEYAGRPEMSEEAADALLEEIQALREAGQLYAADPLAEQAQSIVRRSGVIKALCLHVAHTCNLCCSYCFASQGKFHGDRALMPLNIGMRALDFLVENAGARKHLEVDFFGGEPLMNWKVVKQLVTYGRELERKTGKVFRFTLTTNGMLVDDEVIDFCNREMHNVVLSLDGRKQVHDRFRVDAKGRGSYDEVVPRFQRFAQLRGDKNYYMRGTFTRHNLDFLNDILHMADLGFTELSMEPVVTDPDSTSAIREEDLPVIFEQYEKLAEEMLKRAREGRPLTFYHYMLDLEHGPCLHKRIMGCGSGTEYMAVTPWGDLYPCHQFVGDPAYRLGDIWKGVENTQVQEEFRHCTIYSHEDCRDCWAKLYCSGGCAANNYHASGSISGVYEMGCRIFKKRIECAIGLQAALQQDAEDA